MKNVKTKLKSKAGFSLVELMVVIAIIGILTTIAVPSLNSFQENARMVQAKTDLSAMYTTFSAYQLNNNTYAAPDLADAGYRGSGTIAERYYSTGFSNVAIAAGNWPVPQATATYAPSGKCTAVADPAGASLAGTTMTLAATGCPKAAGQSTKNTWIIDQDRALSQSEPGAL